MMPSSWACSSTIRCALPAVTWSVLSWVLLPSPASRAIQVLGQPRATRSLMRSQVGPAGMRVPGAAGWPLDAIVIVCVVLLNAVLGWLQESKAAQAVAALARMTTATSAVLRGGVVTRVPSAELVVGDLLLLGEGDAVGADARLTQAAALCSTTMPARAMADGSTGK